MLTCSVLTCNLSKEMLSKMLISLQKFTPEMTHFILVDNGSDNRPEVEALVNEHISVNKQFIWNSENKGYGAAHNQALALCNTEYFAVLNDDIEFFDTWADKFISKMDSITVQVGCKNGAFTAWDFQGQAIMSSTPDYVEGSCFTIKTDIAKKFGLFDEIYKYGYWEDGDLSLRLKKAGYKIDTVDINWVHHRAQTSKKINTVDLAGYHVINERIFKNRWNSYLFSKKFGKMIVIKRIGAVGDILLTSALIKPLREKYPDCCIVLQTKLLYLFDRTGIFDGQYPYDYPLECDILIDLDDSYENDFTKHIVDHYADVAGVTVEDKKGIIRTVLDYEDKMLKVLPKEKFFVIDLSDSWSGKRWVGYEKVIPSLKAKGYKVVAVGKMSDSNRNNTKLYAEITRVLKLCDVVLYNKISIPETVAVMKHCFAYLGHEGLVAHLAQSFNKKCVILFGCTLPEYVVNPKSEVLSIISPVVCAGCRHTKNSGHGIVCKRGGICMAHIPASAIIETIEKYF